jgi:tetraacyldisaccharide 4'-kinase
VKWWWRDEPPPWTLALAPLSMLYAAGSRLHRASITPVRSRVPVISVGNLTVGGAGKTPVTMFLASWLRARGRKPAILSRGYGRTSTAPLRVTAETPVRLCGDEPLLLARRGFDVWVGPRRAELAELAVSAGAGVLLLDDGLQHHALERDLDVIVADASNPLGNGALLPRGPLRELPSGLRRVKRGLLWLTRCDLPRQPLPSQLKLFPVVESHYEAHSPDLRGRKVFLFAGIGRPASFEASARSLGAVVTGARWFRDHHWYSAAELAGVRREAGDALPLTTEKDLVRIDRPAGILALPVELRVTAGLPALEAALAEAVP